MIQLVIGFIAGSVVTVVVPKVFAFVKSKIDAVKAKV